MIAIIDYGMGNLKSVSKAFQMVGAQAKVTDNPNDLSDAKAVVLPGVGAFARAMANLTELDILPAITRIIKDGKPFLGICLGLQLLFTESEEHGTHRGLDILKGKVKRFDLQLKTPHMGWNEVKIKSPQSTVHSPQLFEDIADNSYFYFVHTYYVDPDDKGIIIGTTKYGKDFASAVNKDNIWGVQFHPEKSSELGLKFLENFCKLC
ncbi:MAG: imidazole glycerol phosphate synthase subunit HisH [Candidatus Omnitrophica bacterium CG07_land_8_20_14_0_80_42_15]|uniref:Imidazole glycerol phosphate synthase subunit HisH n=1 Tax=Candidatus Aquitaenariimonas noxiae TaxID=1974741 RepID=A0A2J0KT06_9BACT|nr:MAG: imidazole glycerol phosphate synthase subunit HisH [Candidatus Omnitrophica bacterium CG07_land_8_20_14_0_80_42_15]